MCSKDRIVCTVFTKFSTLVRIYSLESLYVETPISRDGQLGLRLSKLSNNYVAVLL